jgi:hypothetical protein
VTKKGEKRKALSTLAEGDEIWCWWLRRTLNIPF